VSNKLTLDSRLTPEHLADIKRGGGVHKRAQEQIDHAGLKQVGGGTPYRPIALHANPHQVGPRWPYAVMRIARILEGCAKTSDLERSVEGAEYKALAKEYLEIYAFYLMRSKPPPPNGKVDHNPFRHMNDYDAFRCFVAKVEAICDKSTKHAGLGKWWV
jgi:hypothetical protein